MPLYRFPNSPKKTSCAPCSSATAASPVSSSPRTEKPARQRASPSSASSTDQTPLSPARRWTVSVTVTLSCASSSLRSQTRLSAQAAAWQAERQESKKVLGLYNARMNFSTSFFYTFSLALFISWDMTGFCFHLTWLEGDEEVEKVGSFFTVLHEEEENNLEERRSR